jgi:arylformamidase
MPSATSAPLVFLNYDQAGLDRAYDQAVFAPNMQEVLAGNAVLSNEVRARIGEPERYTYGTTPVETLDVYKTDKPNAPIHIYLHGGAWRTAQGRNYAFCVEPFVKAGAHYVIPDFAGVETMDGRLPPILEQIKRAVAWVYRSAERFGGDRNRIHVTGHSSGGHWAGVLLLTDWQAEFGLPNDLIKTAFCCSGMYDLEGPSLSARSKYVKFDAATIDAMSAIRHIDKLKCVPLLAYGSNESPEFQRQTRDFAAALAKAGKPTQVFVAEGANHFEITRTLGDPNGVLGRAVFEQMKLRAV